MSKPRTPMAGLMAIAMVACARPGSTPSSDPGAAGDGLTSTGAREGAGTSLVEPVELNATVPLIDGRSLELADLRGRVVILEVASAATPGWAATQSRWLHLVDEVGVDDLVIVSVSIDSTSEAPQQVWDRIQPPFLLGWDPQGALALRLGADGLPTWWVVGRNGRSSGPVAGGPDAVEAQARALLAAKE